MDKLRVAKVDVALLQQEQRCRSGTLHLTQHHLIFATASPSPKSSDNDKSSDSTAATVVTAVEQPEKRKEVWIAYSMLWLVTRLPSIVPIDASNGKPARSSGRRIYPLLLHLRNFQLAALGFESEAIATDVFESVKAAVIAEAPQRLYAFHYTPTPTLATAPAGWRIYDFKAEFARQGVGKRTKAWRLCDVNAGYGFSPTYPAMMCVPSRISDTTIRYAAKYRSKERIPALTYLHWANLASITRSSQPMVGLNNRSMQDEKLVEAIFTSHLFADPMSATAQAASAAASNVTASGNAVTERGKTVAIYGATSANLIIDARPTANAVANRAKGAGTENMEHYRGCKKVYLGIDNIHVMRDSLNRVTDALRAAQPPITFGMQAVAAEQVLATTDLDGNRRRRSSVLTASDAPPLDHLALKRSAWLKHISALLEGTLIIARNIHVYNSHVLIHCSDGWDRTSQLAALAQICLDPYFRTRRGFAVLVEKDWISFGHRFWDRCGHASSEKYFVTADGYGDEQGHGDAGADDETADGGEEGGVHTPTAGDGFDAQAAANAFWGFTKQLRANFQSGQDGHGKRGAHLKEISPVFHQFLDCVWQIMRQHPARFEFNEAWLLDMYDALHECKFGTFLFNCERERNGFFDGQTPSAPASSQTYSVWDAMLGVDGDGEKYINQRYDPSLDTDTKRDGADMGVLLPNSKDVGFWGGLFRRDAKDINQLVRAEAEERKRLVEAAERQQRQEAEDAAATAAAMTKANAVVGPSEVDGVTVGPAIGSGEADPVLRAGVVDVHTFDATKLAYKPRTRSNNQQPTTAGVRASTFQDGQQKTVAPMATSSPPPPAPMNPSNGVRAVGRAPPLREGTDEQVDAGLNAQDTTNKMKNMFLGWGARLQDAYATATTGGPPGMNNNTDELPRVVEARQAKTVRGNSGGNEGFPAIATNPWAGHDEHRTERIDGLPNTLDSIAARRGVERNSVGRMEANPWGEAPRQSRTLPTRVDPHSRIDRSVPSSSLPGSAAAEGDVAATAVSTGSTTENIKDGSGASIEYDPLGVGLG